MAEQETACCLLRHVTTAWPVGRRNRQTSSNRPGGEAGNACVKQRDHFVGLAGFATSKGNKFGALNGTLRYRMFFWKDNIHWILKALGKANRGKIVAGKNRPGDRCVRQEAKN